MKKSIEHFLRCLAASISSAALAGCASLGNHFSNGSSPLPFETVHAAHGEIASTRAFETDEKLYVAGSVRKFHGHHIPPDAHVDVALIGRDGRVIAEAHDEIDPRHPQHEQARGGRYAYVASFPLAQARQAAHIRVTYHLERHETRS